MSRLPSTVHNIICVEKNAPLTCDPIPEWFLQAYIENTRRTHYDDCFAMSCDMNLELMDASDLDNNGVYGI